MVHGDGGEQARQGPGQVQGYGEGGEEGRGGQGKEVHREEGKVQAGGGQVFGEAQGMKLKRIQLSQNKRSVRLKNT